MTADERINALIARAGSPVMVVKNTQESDDEKHNGARAAIERMADEQFHGNVVTYIGNLVDTIDRMEAALHNVICERDQLLADLGKMVNKEGSCEFCRYRQQHAAECKGCNIYDKNHWEWRVVPDTEE